MVQELKAEKGTSFQTIILVHCFRINLGMSQDCVMYKSVKCIFFKQEINCYVEAVLVCIGLAILH
uniref:Phosphatidate phosphatase PAH2-like isoform X1 n=1 Tax=Rhizophora mucronata TaxID=61149 RepID=A0A2P2L6D3_RHIMU